MKIILWTFIWITSSNFLKGQNLVWVNGIGSIEWEAGYSMAIGDSGYVFIAGSFQETVQFGNDVSITSNGWIDTFIAKYDISGNCICAINMGGEYDDYCYSIALDENGNIYGTGSFGRLADFDPSDEVANLSYHGPLPLFSDVFIAKYDSNGNNIWAKSFGSSSFDFGRSLGIHNNDIYLAGTFSGDITINSLGGNTSLTCGGLGDIFLTKFNSDGENIWALSIEGMENDAWYSALSMSVDESGAIYITGDHIGASDFNPTNEENILTPSGISDLYIASYSPDGNYNWAMQTGSELDEVGFSLDVDDFGTIYLTGYFYGTCDFDPTEELMNVQSHGNADIFFAKYSQPTNFIHNENK